MRERFDRLWEKYGEDFLEKCEKMREGDTSPHTFTVDVINKINSEISRAVAKEREENEIQNLASQIALLTLLVEQGTKGDMERLIQEFTEKLTTIKNKPI